MNDIEQIKTRNERVEADKAWETSWTRRLIIAIGTFIVIGIYLNFLGVKLAWLHGLVPATAYLLSTLTLPILKNFWLRHIRKS